MAYNPQTGITTGLGGAAAGMAVGGPVGAAVGGLAGLATGFLGGGSTVNQVPMINPNANLAQQNLLNFGSSGTTPWGYNVTTPYSGSLGDFTSTSQENTGLNTLSSLLNSGNPAIYNTGVNSLSSLLSGTGYDPNNDNGVYAGLTSTMDYNTQKALAGAKAAGAYAGNLYSTPQYQGQSDIEAQNAMNKSNVLAQLYENYANQKINAIPMAMNAATTGQNLGLQQVQASQTYGDLQRQLTNQQDQANYSNWQYQNQQNELPIQALTSVAGSGSNFGVPSVTGANPWSTLGSTLLNSAGYLYGSGNMNTGGNTNSTGVPVNSSSDTLSNPWANTLNPMSANSTGQTPPNLYTGPGYAWGGSSNG